MRERVVVELPSSPPVLTARAARALLAVLLEHVDRERAEVPAPVFDQKKA